MTQKAEFISAGKEEAVASMEDLTVNKMYPDGTAYVNLAFVNQGEKSLYSGSRRIAVIVMKVRKDLRLSNKISLKDVLVIR